MGGAWLLRITTLAVWALAAASVAWWALRFVGAPSQAAGVPTVAAVAPASDPAELARVFGPPTATAATPSVEPGPTAMPEPGLRMALLGVVANRKLAGVALISIDGKPAQPYRVGSRIEDTYRLKSVAARSAVIAPADSPGREFTLELLPLSVAELNGTAPDATAVAPSAAPRLRPGAAVPGAIANGPVFRSPPAASPALVPSTATPAYPALVPTPATPAYPTLRAPPDASRPVTSVPGIVVPPVAPQAAGRQEPAVTATPGVVTAPPPLPLPDSARPLRPAR